MTTTVAELIPGQTIRLFHQSATFVARTTHPIWPALQLVIWKLDDGTWSHDALSPLQHVGDAEPSTPEERMAALRRALLHPSQWGAS